MKRAYLHFLLFTIIIGLTLPGCNIAAGNAGYNYNLEDTTWTVTISNNDLSYRIDKDVTENGNTFLDARNGSIAENIVTLSFSKMEFNKELGLNVGVITFDHISKFKDDFTGQIPYDKETETLTNNTSYGEIFDVKFDVKNTYKNLMGQLIARKTYTSYYSAFVDNNGELCFQEYQSGFIEEYRKIEATKTPSPKTLEDGSFEYDFSTCEFKEIYEKSSSGELIPELGSNIYRPFFDYRVTKVKNGNTFLTFYGETYKLVK